MSKYRVKWTTISDENKRKFRDELLLVKDVSINQNMIDAIELGVCDYLFSCLNIEFHDIERAIRESLI